MVLRYPNLADCSRHRIPGPHRRRFHRRSPRRGAIMVLGAFLFVLLLIAAAFMVDVAYMKLAKTQLQSATDAAARAAAAVLGSASDVEEAKTAAILVARQNLVAGDPLELSESDITFGRSDQQPDGSFIFYPHETPTNGVQIFGRRQAGTGSGAVKLFLGAFLGRDSFEPVATSIVTRLDRDICVVVDRSGSMAWDMSNIEWSYPGEFHHRDLDTNYTSPPHPTLSRWAALVNAFDVFVDCLDDTDQAEKLSLVSFAHAYSGYGLNQPTVRTEHNMTFNYSSVRNAAHGIGDNDPICGGTNIAAGIDRGRQILTNVSQVRPFAFKTMVVMTDGNWNTGNNPVNAAIAAANKSIQVHTITFSAQADQDLMREVARRGNGLHIHAENAAELNAAFRRIAYTLPVVTTQ